MKYRFSNPAFLLFCLCFSLVSSCTTMPDKQETTLYPSSFERGNLPESTSFNFEDTGEVVASYEKGTLLSTTTGQMNKIDVKTISIIVLYEKNAEWAKKMDFQEMPDRTGNSHFDKLLTSYDLSISSLFDWDDDYKGLILSPNNSLTDPLDASGQISLIENVIMVHVKAPDESQL